MTRAPTASHAAPTRQKRTGETRRQRTRERLVEAAAEVFAEQGYAGATVTAIADRAGVSLQTLYTAWGSKRRLLRAYVELTMTGSSTAISDDRWVPQLQSRIDTDSSSDAWVRMRRIAKIFTEIALRMGLCWRLTRDAAGVDPEVAEDHAELERMRRRSMAGLLAGIDEFSLRPGLSFDAAVDTTVVIASPNSYESLVLLGGYTSEEFEEWLGDTLTAALIRPPPPVPEVEG